MHNFVTYGIFTGSNEYSTIGNTVKGLFYNGWNTESGIASDRGSLHYHQYYSIEVDFIVGCNDRVGNNSGMVGLFLGRSSTQTYYTSIGSLLLINYYHNGAALTIAEGDGHIRVGHCWISSISNRFMGIFHEHPDMLYLDGENRGSLTK